LTSQSPKGNCGERKKHLTKKRISMVPSAKKTSSCKKGKLKFTSYWGETRKKKRNTRERGARNTKSIAESLRRKKKFFVKRRPEQFRQSERRVERNAKRKKGGFS